MYIKINLIVKEHDSITHYIIVHNAPKHSHRGLLAEEINKKIRMHKQDWSICANKFTAEAISYGGTTVLCTFLYCYQQCNFGWNKLNNTIM